jgi:hypothetical protein
MYCCTIEAEKGEPQEGHEGCRAVILEILSKITTADNTIYEVLFRHEEPYFKMCDSGFFENSVIINTSHKTLQIILKIISKVSYSTHIRF